MKLIKKTVFYKCFNHDDSTSVTEVGQLASTKVTAATRNVVESAERNWQMNCNEAFGKQVFRSPDDPYTKIVSIFFFCKIIFQHPS